MTDYVIGQEYDVRLIGTDDYGEGFVRIGESFYHKDPMLQVDLINDWICDLEQYRDSVRETWYSETDETVSEENEDA